MRALGQAWQQHGTPRRLQAQNVNAHPQPSKPGAATTRPDPAQAGTSLISAERGDLQNEYIEITEDEANRIVERIRAAVTGASNG